MSYNIDSSNYVGKGRLTIDAAAAFQFYNEHEEELPECTFLEELDGDDEGQIEVKPAFWYGEGSGGSIDLFKEVLALTKGEAKILLIWEGGDSITGLKVKDGVVTEGVVRIEID